MIIVLMGVCGSGKTLIGKMLSEKINLRFYDADNFHSEKNIKKMSKGIPLNDIDRIPWIKEISKKISELEKQEGAVIACSALKESYREILKKGGNIKFIYLKGTKELIEERMRNRKNHFASFDLINSQFKILEEPKDAIIININKSPNEIVEEIISKLNNKRE